VNYDTWEKTDAALRAINKLFCLLHDNKPAKSSPEEAIWEAELKEVRQWAISVHERRINLNIATNKVHIPPSA
jgi:hypothetical protein